MRKLWLGSLLLAIITGFVVTHAATLGMQAVWPFFAGLALAPLGVRGNGLMRVGASAIAGVAIGVGVFVVVSEWMPFIPVSFGITVAVGVALMGTVAAVVPKVLSLPSMLLAFGVFYGSYEAQWIADRAAFRGEAAAAAASVVLSLLGGVVASWAISQLLAIEARQRAGEVIPFRARLRVAHPEPGQRAAAGGM